MADEKKASPTNADEPHPDYPGLTRGEVEDAKKRAAKKIAAEKKAEALARIQAQEEIDQRAAMGETERTAHELENLSPGNREMVEITLGLAPQMADIRLDGVIYRNRGTYLVTRAKAAEMSRIQFEGWRHEAVRKGDDSYAFYAQMNQQARSVQVAPGIKSSLVLHGPTGAVMAGQAPRGTH